MIYNSQEYCFLKSTRTKTIVLIKKKWFFFKFGGNGHYLLKKEKFSWELIPLDQKSMIEFDLSLLKSDFIHAKVVGVDKEGRYVKEIPQTKKGIVTVQAEEGVYKYQLIPQLD